MKNVQKLVLIKDKNNTDFYELLREFNPTIESHIKPVDDRVSEILMGRCPPGTRPGGNYE